MEEYKRGDDGMETRVGERAGGRKKQSGGVQVDEQLREGSKGKLENGQLTAAKRKKDMERIVGKEKNQLTCLPLKSTQHMK